MYRLIYILIFITIYISANAQSDTYIIKKAPFSTQKFDEFSPVFYKGSLVFCSNMGGSAFTGFSSGSKPFFRIVMADTSRKANVQSTELPGEVNSPFNNGPATFNKSGDTVYFSRNLIVGGNFREITDEGNRLGLFFAVLRNGRWTDVQEMRFNDHSWNVTTPYLSPDGKRLYFASDKPEGMGGSDLYYSEWKGGYWNNPVNLGEIVNTEGNEAYPFINESGDLFFSSDGHKGRGGKDIFFTRFADTAWIKPVALDPPINSNADDFGFVADNINARGWFSTNRGNMLDIYSFTTITPQFLYCEEQKDNDLCFSFADDGSIEIDPLSLQFSWDFGDGKPQIGYLASHCFQGPGTYTIRQDVIDRKTGKVVFNKLFLKAEILDPGKPRIKSVDVVAPGKEIVLAGEEVKGFQPIGYFWNIEGKKVERGASVTHVFNEPGEHQIRMLANMKDSKTGTLSQYCVTRIINVAQSATGMAGRANQKPETTVDGLSWFGSNRNARIDSAWYSNEIAEKGVYAVQLFSSPKRITVNDAATFGKIGPDYNVKTLFSEEDKSYSYIIDEQLSLMAAMPSLRKALSSGYKDAKIITYVPEDPGELDLLNFRRNNNTESGLLFVNNGVSISQEGIPILDRLMLLLRRNPEMSLIVAVHTERNGSAWASLQLSRRQAQSIVDYLVGMGIDKSRLTAIGYGSSRPIFPDYPESEKLRNRRVDFIKDGQ